MKIKTFPTVISLVSAIACFSIIKMATAQTAPDEQNPESVSLEEKLSEWRARDLEELKICDGVFEAEANVIFEGN